METKSNSSNLKNNTVTKEIPGSSNIKAPVYPDNSGQNIAIKNYQAANDFKDLLDRLEKKYKKK